MTDRHPDGGTIRVRKRDGEVERFSLPKLMTCMRRGLDGAGDAAGFSLRGARGLAEAVQTYLAEMADTDPVMAARIADMVYLVLTHTGHGEAAMAIQEFARERERDRRRVLVATRRKVDGRYAQRRWKKGLVVSHLRRQHLLDAPVSRMIAGRVEQLVFNCGLRVVTSGLVTEMVRSELLAWGLLPAALMAKRVRRPRRGRRLQDNVDHA
ncbi:MAG: hypothetical protein ACE5F9_06530 [Phycisphaerae bacterium]